MIINGKEPDPDPELELTNPDPGERTRQAAELLRTEVRRNSFSVRVAWNQPSKETRKSRNVQQFKRTLKNEWIKSKAEKKRVKSDEQQHHEVQSTALKSRKTI